MTCSCGGGSAIAGIFADAGKACPEHRSFSSLWQPSPAATGLVLPLLIGAVLLLRLLGAQTQGPRLHGPGKVAHHLVGRLIRLLAVARFARTLAPCLSSGVPVLTALDIVKRVLNNTVLEKVIEDARVAIREGESIAATLKKSGQFPSMMCHMVAVGERLRATGGHVGERGRRLRARRGRWR